MLITNKQYVLCIIICIFFSSSAYSQVNIEQIRWKGEKPGLSSVLDAGLALRTGNTEVVDLSASGTIGYRLKNHILFLVGKSEYGTREDENYLNRAMGHLRYNYLINNNVAWEVFTQGEFDEFRLLSDRRLLGSGLRLMKSYNNNAMNTALGISYMYEMEKYDIDNPGLVKSRYDNRLSSYIVFNLRIDERISAGFVTYVQPCIERFEDIKIIGDGLFSFQLSRSLKFMVSANLGYDTDPPSAVKKLDFVLKNGMMLEF